MEAFLFRHIALSEIDTVHDIYNEAFEWLKGKGIRQWLTYKPRSFFEDFQRKGRLYGLFAGDELAVFAAMTQDKPPHWANEFDISNGAWIHRLTLKPRFRGQGIGALLVKHLIAEANENGASHICLDVVDVNGIMPAYYAALGFQKRKAADVTYPNGNTFPIVYMDISYATPYLAAESMLRCDGYEESKL
jgi:ribosomal protein S18 acetylase RimI-like enzyme